MAVNPSYSVDTRGLSTILIIILGDVIAMIVLSSHMFT